MTTLETIELPFICFEDVVTATDNFSDYNMLGKGGFGKVYKVIFFNLIIINKKSFHLLFN